MAAATFVEELVDHLALHNVGTKGTDLFADFLPDISGDAAAVKQTGGPPPSQASPKWAVNIQVLTRATTYTGSVGLASQIYNIWHQMISKTLENNRIITSLAVSAPAGIGQDESKRHLVSTNYVMWGTFIDQTISDDEGTGGATGGGWKLPNRKIPAGV